MVNKIKTKLHLFLSLIKKKKEIVNLDDFTHLSFMVFQYIFTIKFKLLRLLIQNKPNMVKMFIF